MFCLHCFLSIFIIVLVSLASYPDSAWADSTLNVQETVMKTKTPKEKSKQTGLTNHTKQIGFSLGPGFGSTWFGTHKHHDFILGEAHYGLVVSNDKAIGEWYQGNWEILGEFEAGLQYEPSRQYLFSLVPMLRYNLTRWQNLVPFFNIGAGVAYTNIEEPDLSTKFQFTPQGGLGIHYFLRSYFALTWQYRFLHISNAGIEEPNDGVNSHLILLGLNWFY